MPKKIVQTAPQTMRQRTLTRDEYGESVQLARVSAGTRAILRGTDANARIDALMEMLLGMDAVDEILGRPAS